MPLTMAISFVISLLLVAVFVIAPPGAEAGQGILGGPAEITRHPRVSGLPILLAQGTILPVPSFDVQTPPMGIGGNVLFTAAVRDTRAITRAASAASNIFTYRVQRGDTAKKIAARFGVSLASLVDANPRLKQGKITSGDAILVLSTSGTVHRTGTGESVETIAARFNMENGDILRLNQNLALGPLPEGTVVIIPNLGSSSASRSLPSLSGYFKKPTDGYDWGKLHNYNAVDMAAVCGTPVFSAAEGIVIPDADFGDGAGGWNGGYGRFVMIEHPTATKTRYAHLDTMAVSVGDYVKQGELIGTIGKTGDASGCHLHFEVYGAANPFARK